MDPYLFRNSSKICAFLSNFVVRCIWCYITSNCILNSTLLLILFSGSSSLIAFLGCFPLSFQSVALPYRTLSRLLSASRASRWHTLASFRCRQSRLCTDSIQKHVKFTLLMYRLVKCERKEKLWQPNSVSFVWEWNASVGIRQRCQCSWGKLCNSLALAHLFDGACMYVDCNYIYYMKCFVSISSCSGAAAGWMSEKGGKRRKREKEKRGKAKKGEKSEKCKEREQENEMIGRVNGSIWKSWRVRCECGCVRWIFRWQVHLKRCLCYLLWFKRFEYKKTQTNARCFLHLSLIALEWRYSQPLVLARFRNIFVALLLLPFFTQPSIPRPATGRPINLLVRTMMRFFPFKLCRRFDNESIVLERCSWRMMRCES